VEVELVYFEDCPNWQVAHARLQEALAALGRSDVPVRLHLVRDPAEAQTAGMRGSPTILVDGRDLFPEDDDLPVWSCRLYPVEGVLEGAPSLAALLAALR
jgi:hypothetical protein